MIGLIMYIDTHKSYTHWGARRLQELEFFTKLNFQYFVKLPACNPIHIQILVSIKSHKVKVTDLKFGLINSKTLMARLIMTTTFNMVLTLTMIMLNFKLEAYFLQITASARWRAGAIQQPPCRRFFATSATCFFTSHQGQTTNVMFAMMVHSVEEKALAGEHLKIWWQLFRRFAQMAGVTQCFLKKGRSWSTTNVM